MNIKKIIFSVIGALGVSLATSAQSVVAVLTDDQLNNNPNSISLEDVRQQRGLVDAKNIFVPRGQWIFGGYASYSTHVNDNYNFMVFDDINSDGYTFKVSPMIAYAVRDNMAIGLRGIYGRTLLRLDSAKLSLGAEETGTNVEAENYYSLKHNYSLAFIWRQYIPLGQDKRFALFTEMSLAGGGHETKFAANMPVKGTFENGYDLSLGVSPGLIAFISNTMAVELNVGVMGLSFKHSHQLQNQVSEAEVNTSYMNFSVNILSIGLGVSFYL